MKKIAVAVDFSDATPVVVEMGRSLASLYGAELCLLHAVEPEPSYTAYGFTPDEFPALHAYQAEAMKRAQVKLDELAAPLRNDVDKVSCELLSGGPTPCILDYIGENHCDFVIVGSHGHGVLASLLIGSVAEGLVRKSHVPTLVVPVAERK